MIRNPPQSYIALCLLIFGISGCLDRSEPPNKAEAPTIEAPIIKEYDSFSVSKVQDSYISGNHTAEGFLVTLKSGRIFHFFRIEEGELSDHAGNGGKIVKRYSDNDGVTWSKPQLIYDSEFDDRNVHGGITNEGIISLFFRRYDVKADGSKVVDIGYLYSADGGQSFLGPYFINTSLMGGFGTDSLSYVPEKGYMMALNGARTSQIDLYFSETATDWGAEILSLDYSTNYDVSMNEATFSYIGKKHLIGLVRNLNGKHNYYQIISNDLGETWSEPILSNIGSTYNVVGPLSFYDERSDMLFVIATDRRKPYGNQGLKIYHTPIKKLVTNGFNHDFKVLISNVISTERYFYGYPTATRLLNGNYLVVYTDNTTKENGKENANFYQFYIEFE